jgi:hypothetical protein
MFGAVRRCSLDLPERGGVPTAALSPGEISKILSALRDGQSAGHMGMLNPVSGLVGEDWRWDGDHAGTWWVASPVASRSLG